jgi:hypothetical protein
MKLSVSNPVGALDLRGAAASIQRRRRPGGRLRCSAGLYEAVLPLYGTIVLAEAMSLIQVGRTLQFLLAGSALGVVLGKASVVWREWRGPELAPERVRRIEISYILAGLASALLLSLVS